MYHSHNPTDNDARVHTAAVQQSPSTHSLRRRESRRVSVMYSCGLPLKCAHDSAHHNSGRALRLPDPRLSCRRSARQSLRPPSAQACNLRRAAGHDFSSTASAQLGRLQQQPTLPSMKQELLGGCKNVADHVVHDFVTIRDHAYRTGAYRTGVKDSNNISRQHVSRRAPKIGRCDREHAHNLA